MHLHSVVSPPTVELVDSLLERPFHTLDVQRVDAALRVTQDPSTAQRLRALRAVVFELSMERPLWHKRVAQFHCTFARERTLDGLRAMIGEVRELCRSTALIHLPVAYLEQLTEDAVATREVPGAPAAVDDLVAHLNHHLLALRGLQKEWTAVAHREQATRNLAHWIRRRDALFLSSTPSAEVFRVWGLRLLGASLDLLHHVEVSGSIREQGFVTEALDATQVHADHFASLGSV